MGKEFNKYGQSIQYGGFQKLSIPKLQCNTYHTGMKTGNVLQCVDCREPEFSGSLEFKMLGKGYEKLG